MGGWLCTCCVPSDVTPYNQKEPFPRPQVSDMERLEAKLAEISGEKGEDGGLAPAPAPAPQQAGRARGPAAAAAAAQQGQQQPGARSTLLGRTGGLGFVLGSRAHLQVKSDELYLFL